MRDDPRVLETLIALLRDEDGEFTFPEPDESPYDNPHWRSPRVVGYAIWALGELGHSGATEALLAFLGDPERMLLREAVAEALGKIGDPQAVDALIERLADTKYVAKYAAQALGRIGDPRAVAPLLRELESDCWERRAHAAGALGALGDRRALAPLIACLGDAEWLVRRAAADSLERFGLTLPRDLADDCEQMTEPERDEIRARFGLPLQGKADEN